MKIQANKMNSKKILAVLFAVLIASCATSSYNAHRTPASARHITVVGGSESSFFPDPGKAEVVQEAAPCNGKSCDVVIIGAGLAGLSSAVYLTDHGKRVLILEKESHLGGLAAASTSGVKYDRGAAYWTDAYEEEQKILDHIGLGDYQKDEIPEPIDSYFWKGHLYRGIWDDATMKALPASFDVFWFELKQADANAMIPNQPFEEADDVSLDKLSTRQWIESMSGSIAGHLPDQEKRVADAEAKLAELKKKSKTSQPKHLADEDKDIEAAVKAVEDAKKTLEVGRRGWARFQEERKAGKLSGPTGMEEVVQLMDLYCRSALGTTGDGVSALAFSNFYISEIVPRYTTPLGTGMAAKNMVENNLKMKPDQDVNGEDLNSGKGPHASYLTQAKVTSVRNIADGVEVKFLKDGKLHVVQAPHVVFSSQLTIAPMIIEGFGKDAKSATQAQLMRDLGYSHYSVHGVKVKGHPYRASYDTWTRGYDPRTGTDDYSDDDFTDIILGRWMEYDGYKKYQDFSTKVPEVNSDPEKEGSVLTIYHPLSQKWISKDKNGHFDFKGYDDKAAIQVAEYAVDRMEKLYSQLPADTWQGPLDITEIETSRWPFSVHIPAPGHFAHIRELRKPFGNVFFAHSNLGAPAFEEALFRGHCAADNILAKANTTFKVEKWSRCPCELRTDDGQIDTAACKKHKFKLKQEE